MNDELRKAAEQALDAFEKIYEGCGEVKKDDISKHSNGLAIMVRKDCLPQIEALRQALAQPVDLAKVGEVGVWGEDREWVGLTDEERENFRKLGFVGVSAVENKLKEKNG